MKYQTNPADVYDFDLLLAEFDCSDKTPEEEEAELLEELAKIGRNESSFESPPIEDIEISGPFGPTGPGISNEVAPSEELHVAVPVEEDANISVAMPTIPLEVSDNSTTANLLQAQTPTSCLPQGYELAANGVYEKSVDDAADPIYVCTPLRIDATFADQQGKGRGRLVSVRLSDGQWHQIAIKNADLMRRSTEVIATLIDHGLEISLDKKTKDRLLNLLNRLTSDIHLQCVSRMGWVNDEYTSFVVGSSIVGSAAILPPASATGIGSGLVTAGTIAEWKIHVGAKCRGNPLMLLSVSLAFSGPLLAVLGLPGGGLHFRGASSSGKTTLLNLAASVWGRRSLISQWRATANGLEAIAATLNDMLLPLDEIAEISAAELSNAIYMLANGTGKARMNMNVTLADQARWRLALISSGEISVQEKLKEARLDVKTGHEVRLIDVEADSRAYGAFDVLHGAVDAANFAESVQQVARKHYGAIGREFVKQLIEKKTLARAEVLDRLVRGHVANWLKMLPGVADGPTSRVATRFAVIGTAGALATKFGLTGWTDGEAVAAAEQAFLDWYDRRYGVKREAVASYVQPLQNFLAANLNALPDLSGPHVAGVWPLGWSDATRAYLPKMTWESVFSGMDATKAAKALLDMDMLLPGEDGRLNRKAPRSIEGRPRLYTVNIERVMSFKVG